MPHIIQSLMRLHSAHFAERLCYNALVNVNLAWALMVRHYNPSHRRQAIQWAQNLLARNFYVLDTETTGLGKSDEIVQIGIVDAAGNTVIDQLIKPSIPIPPGVSRIHGITDAHVVNAPSFFSLYAKLSGLLAGETLVAYNMDFDWRMLRQSFVRYKLPPIRIGKRDCVMKQYAKFKGKRSGQGRGYVWHKLTKALAQENIPMGTMGNAHDALGDARMTLELLRAMANAA